MKENLTELVFILDRSGSMSGLEADTIGGYNSLLEKQRLVEGEANVSTILFDHEIQTIHDRVSIQAVKPITKEAYYVRGCTALYDAIGMTMDHIGEALSKTDEKDRPSKVVFVIITDGMENASEKYSHTIVKNMIDHQQSKYNWEFVFLGANFDAEAFAESISIDRNNAVRYENSSAGVKMNYVAVDELVMCLRTDVSKKVNKDWKKKIKKEEK